MLLYYRRSESQLVGKENADFEVFPPGRTKGARYRKSRRDAEARRTAVFNREMFENLESIEFQDSSEVAFNRVQTAGRLRGQNAPTNRTG